MRVCGLLMVAMIAFWHSALSNTRLSGGIDSLMCTVHEFTGIDYDLMLAYDNLGNPSHYHAYIFTPVCDDDTCKPVFITLFWDLVGNYLRYEVPQEFPLTKMDHVEFEANEYIKFQEILSNKNSLLRRYKEEELVEATSNVALGSVDAVTGATVKSLQAAIIPGALYTCYTLWHIANGQVTDSIARLTDAMMNSRLLSLFLTSSQYSYQYFALDRIVDVNGYITEPHHSEVMDLIGSKNVFLATAVLKRLSPVYFADDSTQNMLWGHFMNGNYRLKLSVLDKFSELVIRDDIKELMVEQADQYNEEIKKRVENLLRR